MMNIIPYGSNGLLINFEQKIEPEIHNQVKSYFNAIRDIEEVLYQIPAYCSITLTFDKNRTTFKKLKARIEEIEPKSEELGKDSKLIEIPVCYDTEFGPDLDTLSSDLKLSTDEIISLHTSVEYDVYMMGFLPGFPYLGKLPTELQCKRKTTPRNKVKAGSVAIAGNQTGIYPSDAPGGWQLIGETPLKIFDPTKEDAILIKMGDKIKFTAISKETFKELNHND